jgi:hypothetical protein
MADFPLTGVGAFVPTRSTTPTSLPAGQVVATGSDTNSVANSGRTYLRVQGTTGTTGNMVIASPGATKDGINSPGKIVTLTATMDTIIGPFPPDVYGSTLSISYTGTTAGAKLTAVQLTG